MIRDRVAHNLGLWDVSGGSYVLVVESGRQPSPSKGTEDRGCCRWVMAAVGKSPHNLVLLVVGAGMDLGSGSAHVTASPFLII